MPEIITQTNIYLFAINILWLQRMIHFNIISYSKAEAELRRQGYQSVAAKAKECIWRMNSK